MRSPRTQLCNLFSGNGACLTNHIRCSSQLFGTLRNEAFIDTASSDYRTIYEENRAAFSKYLKIKKKAKEARSEKAIQRHIKRKWLVADRIKRLLDDDSHFLEIGTIAGHEMDYGDVPGAGSVVGIGQVNGMNCIVAGNDATVKGGTVFPIGVKKQLRAQEISAQLALPLIYLTDSGGAYLPLQAEIFPDMDHGGRSFYEESLLGAKNIPQISIVCGSCTAGAAYIPALADDTVFVDKVGHLFLGGPPLVKAATGEVIDSENLGGATVHCSSSGVGDYFAANEEEAINYTRDVLLTTNYARVRDLVCQQQKPWFPRYHAAELDGVDVIKDDPHLFYKVVARIGDQSWLHEYRLKYGDHFKCGFIHLHGHLTGVIGQSGNRSALDVRSCEKVAQFVQVCEQRGVPLLFLHLGSTDSWVDGNSEENMYLMKSIAQVIQVVATTTVPKIVLYAGPSTGIQHYLLCGRAFEPSFSFAWPNARIAMIQGDKDLDEVAQAKLRLESSPLYAASRLWIDDVILPSSTRDVLKRAFDVARGAKQRQDLLRYDGERGVIRM